MSLDKARGIVKQAMADRSVYDTMAARENEVWGKVLPVLENSEAKLEVATATAKLNANRHQSYLIGVAHEKNLRFRHGSYDWMWRGKPERAVIQEGICSSFHGIDISEMAIAAAREIAKKQGLSLTYEVADVNFVKLPEKTISTNKVGNFGGDFPLPYGAFSFPPRAASAMLLVKCRIHYITFTVN
jgi:hypothetical protein